jgi:hypothetical protein
MRERRKISGIKYEREEREKREVESEKGRSREIDKGL